MSAWRIMHQDPTAVEGRTLDPALVRRVGRFAHPYRWQLVGFITMIAAGAGLALVPPLLFRTITVGFCLLTLTLVTGVLFVDDLLAQKLVHKTVLSVLSWLVFGTLMIGRRRHGWRGVKAVHWTLSAMVLLLLAFFGSQFVIELVFGHPR